VPLQVLLWRQWSPQNCKELVNAAKKECFCQDSNILKLSEEDKELCVAWIANGSVPVGGAAVTNYAPLIAPIAGVLGAATAAGAGGSTIVWPWTIQMRSWRGVFSNSGCPITNDAVVDLVALLWDRLPHVRQQLFRN